jgi:hypothetical protein
VLRCAGYVRDSARANTRQALRGTGAVGVDGVVYDANALYGAATGVEYDANALYGAATGVEYDANARYGAATGVESDSNARYGAAHGMGRAAARGEVHMPRQAALGGLHWLLAGPGRLASV